MFLLTVCSLLLLLLLSHFSCVRLYATPWIVACTKLLRPWDFQGKSTGVGCYFLLQGIFPTQGSNPGLLYCRQNLYCLSQQMVGPKIFFRCLNTETNVNIKIRLIIFFAAKDGEALYSQQKQDWELTVAQIMNFLLQNSDLD